jgi:hypothetical protein
METFTSSYKVQLLLRAKGDRPGPETLLFDDVRNLSDELRGDLGVRSGVRIRREPAGIRPDERNDGTFVGGHPSAANVDRVFDVMWEVATKTPDKGSATMELYRYRVLVPAQRDEK